MHLQEDEIRGPWPGPEEKGAGDLFLPAGSSECFLLLHAPYTPAGVFSKMSTHTYIYIYVCMYVCIYIYIYIYICVYVYIYTHTHTYMFATTLIACSIVPTSCFAIIKEQAFQAQTDAYGMRLSTSQLSVCVDYIHMCLIMFETVVVHISLSIALRQQICYTFMTTVQL